MAEDTGGRCIDVGNNGKKMEDAFSQIEEELRTQYVASYTPTNAKLDGTYRKIDLEVKGDGLKLQVAQRVLRHRARRLRIALRCAMSPSTYLKP